MLKVHEEQLKLILQMRKLDHRSEIRVTDS